MFASQLHPMIQTVYSFSKLVESGIQGFYIDSTTYNVVVMHTTTINTSVLPRRSMIEGHYYLINPK